MLKLCMLDLVHPTCGITSKIATVPLGIGLMATYLKKNIASPLDIKIFKDPEKALDVLRSLTPDILGISQYSWNSELNLHFARLVKQMNPNCLVVAGGPNLENSAEKRKIYLQKNSFVDICVAYDGEIPVKEIVEGILNGKSTYDLKIAPVAGAYCLNPDLEYIESTESFPRLEHLDVFGPIYAEGVFDEFLDAGYHPFTQTHRGCPFSCAFCQGSDPYNSKMLFLSPEIFKQDMEYLGKRFAGRPEIMLYIANTNMSLFKEDFPIAYIIRDMQDKYDWPRYVWFSTGRNTKKIFDMLSIIRFVPMLALQTLTPSVLKNIRRKNLSLEDYIGFQQEVLKRVGENSVSELILCLPGETKETFLETLKKVINSGVQGVVVHTLVKLPGTPLSTEEFVKEYNYLLRYRVVPRQHSVINGKKVLDTEEVIVGTKDMSFDDYVYFRDFCFTLNIFFNVVEFVPLKRFLLEYGVDIAQWLFDIHKRLRDYPLLYAHYQNYLRETKEELFSTREELLEFFEKQDNFEDLISGRRGDNLLRKYKFIARSFYYESCLEIAASEALNIISKTLPRIESEKMINSLVSFLSTRNLKSVFENNNNIDIKHIIDLEYDVVVWLKNEDKAHRLEHFNGSFKYLVQFDEGQKKMLKSNDNIYENPNLTMFSRDGYMHDLWPKWVLL